MLVSTADLPTAARIQRMLASQAAAGAAAARQFAATRRQVRLSRRVLREFQTVTGRAAECLRRTWEALAGPPHPHPAWPGNPAPAPATGSATPGGTGGRHRTERELVAAMTRREAMARWDSAAPVARGSVRFRPRPTDLFFAPGAGPAWEDVACFNAAEGGGVVLVRHFPDGREEWRLMAARPDP
jgi:hypothetical protein